MKIIEHYLNFRPSAQWIVEQSKLPFLELNISVPHEKIYQEWLTVQHLAVLHRSQESISDNFFYGHKGWKSLVIYGTSSTATSDTNGPMSWTEIADRCPITVEWLKQNFCFDETTQRIRFMLLDPQGYILPHCDESGDILTAINVAINNPAECFFRFVDYGNVPFANGKAFMLNISNKHLVYNNSNIPRLHLIIHSKLKDPKVIEESYAKRYYN